MVRDSLPLQPVRERIAGPRDIIDGLLIAVHIRFSHPSEFQLKCLISRYFFALDLDQSITAATSSCHHCQSLKKVPTYLQAQTTSLPPEIIGCSFAADIMRRSKQHIFLLRETASAYTMTSFVNSEQRSDILQCLLSLTAETRCLGDHKMVIRVDPAPAFVSLKHDSELTKYNIDLEIGHPKNINKNPVAERAIQELGMEILHLEPEGGPITPLTLAQATASLTARIRHGGLSAREIWTQSDQITLEQLLIDDRKLIVSQHHARIANHKASSISKAHNHGPLPDPELSVGDLVYLLNDRDKHSAQNKSS